MLWFQELLKVIFGLLIIGFLSFEHSTMTLKMFCIGKQMLSPLFVNGKEKSLKKLVFWGCWLIYFCWELTWTHHECSLQLNIHFCSVHTCLEKSFSFWLNFIFKYVFGVPHLSTFIFIFFTQCNLHSSQCQDSNPFDAKLCW